MIYFVDECIVLMVVEFVYICMMFGVFDYDLVGGVGYISVVCKFVYNVFFDWVVDVFDWVKVLIVDVYGLIEIDNLLIDDGVMGSLWFEEIGCLFKVGVLSENVLVVLSMLVGELYLIVYEGCELVNNLMLYKVIVCDYMGLGFEVEFDFYIENVV